MDRLLNNIKELQRLLSQNLTAQEDKEVFAELCLLESIRKQMDAKYLVKYDKDISYGSYFGVDWYKNWFKMLFLLE